MRHVEHVMGTAFSFDVRTHADPRAARSAIADAVAWLHRVDAVFSTFRPDSQISRLGAGELRLDQCDHDVAEVLDMCARAGVETRGYFSAAWNGRIDPTGLVKGWSVQRASELLAAAGFANHCVNGGGDVRAAGEPEPGRAWNVAISHPFHAGAFAGVVEVRDGAVATSGTAERGAHVVDPFTGRAASELASVTVIGADLTRCDAYATAAVAMGRAASEWLTSLAGYNALVIAADGSAWTTPGYRALCAPAAT